MRQVIERGLEEGIAARRALAADSDKMIRASELIVKAFRGGNKILAAGNGGSAADAQHFTAEFEGKFDQTRPGLPAICLNVNASTLTAWANDFEFDTIFSRQIEAHGKPGDVLVAISTGGGSFEAGYSRNIALAAQKAKEMGLSVIGLAGKSGGVLKEMADVCIVVNSNVTARIQECHITVLHLITQLVDLTMFPPAGAPAAHTEREK